MGVNYASSEFGFGGLPQLFTLLGFYEIPKASRMMIEFPGIREIWLKCERVRIDLRPPKNWFGFPLTFMVQIGFLIFLYVFLCILSYPM